MIYRIKHLSKDSDKNWKKCACQLLDTETDIDRSEGLLVAINAYIQISRYFQK